MGGRTHQYIWQLGNYFVVGIDSFPFFLMFSGVSVEYQGTYSKAQKKTKGSQAYGDRAWNSSGCNPLKPYTRAMLVSLKENTTVSIFLKYSERGKTIIKMHERIEDCLKGDINDDDGKKKLAVLKEAIEDLFSYSLEEI